MSAEMVSSTDTIELYVPLLNEGTDVMRPTRGQVLEPGVAQVLATPDYDATVEDWAFPPGTKVRYVSELRGGRRLLVAHECVD